MDGQYGWMDKMDGRTDGWNGMEWVDGWKPFPLQIEDSTGFFLRILNPARRLGGLKILGKSFCGIFNLQSKCKQGIANLYQGIKKGR